MRKKVSAFSPASLSCVFLPEITGSSAKMLSRGLRIALNQGVVATVYQSSKTTVSIEGKEVKIAALDYALTQLELPAVQIEIEASFPFSFGFGMSAACTIASLLAVNDLLSLWSSEDEIYNLAHISEVKSGTGIGDVGAQRIGGVSLMPEDAREPFDLKQIHVSSHDLYVRTFSPINTGSIISNPELLSRIETAARVALKKLQVRDKLEMSEILDISLEFARSSGLLKDKEVTAQINDIESKGGHASMIMLGNSVVANMEFPFSQKVKIGHVGARVL